jgi:diguanylate cyclase (GGDEF)-like protein
MSPASNALWICAAALAVTSASLTAFGLRQAPNRGWRWWVVALWLTSLGTAAAAAGKPGHVAATLLMMQWPVLTLIGVRRFHARSRLPLNEAIDWAVLAAAAAAAMAASLWAGDGALAAWLSAAAAVLVQLYAACLQFSGPAGREAVPLLWLSVTIALVALLPLPASWPGYELRPSIELRAAAATLGAVVMAFVALTLIWERTERRLRDTLRRLRLLANIDSLTNVPNRRHFHELATLALRHDAPGSATLLMFDIDHFKRINDTYGHGVGDEVLCKVAEIARREIKAEDLVGRIGGEEFVCILSGLTDAETRTLAERLCFAIAHGTEQAICPAVTISVGLAVLREDDSIETLMCRADAALYEAKENGRNQVRRAA